MIDENGYRANVGIIIINDERKLLWAQRLGQKNAWQFPQGGIDEGEQPIDALWRELKEELGLEPHQVELLAESQQWLTYLLPKKFIRYSSRPLCLGQKQRWFLLQLKVSPGDIKLDQFEAPEFKQIRWVDPKTAIAQVIEFKHDVYQQALAEFAGYLKSN